MKLKPRESRNRPDSEGNRKFSDVLAVGAMRTHPISTSQAAAESGKASESSFRAGIVTGSLDILTTANDPVTIP